MANSEISFHIHGENKVGKISPDNFDISELKELLEIAERLTRTTKKEDTITTYIAREGSLNAVFRTSAQKAAEVAAMLGMVVTTSSIDQIEIYDAQTIEKIQQFAISHHYTIEISAAEQAALHITPTTNLTRSENIWVDGEDYIFGMVTDAGGSREDSTNLHFLPPKQKTLVIKADQKYLRSIAINPLYKEFYAHVTMRQNLITGEIDKKSYVLIELIERKKEYNEQEIKELIERSTKTWEGIDADEYLKQIRGNEYA